MRNSINNRSRFVFGVRQSNVVVAGRDRLRSLADAHLFVSRPKAKSCAKPSSCTTSASYCTTAAAAFAAREAGMSRAGIPARQRWQPMHRLPHAPSSRS
ncbi:MAG: hypothetical protein WD875_08425 [Pirellulales bacterium]